MVFIRWNIKELYMKKLELSEKLILQRGRDVERKININELDDAQKQALICMYYAMLPKSDSRYRQRMDDWLVLEKRFGKKKSTYKHAKDSFDFYFPDNGRKGWSNERSLKRRGPEYQEIYDLYGRCSANQLEKIVKEIIDEYKNEEAVFVSMKCGFPETVHDILQGKKSITIDGVYTLKEELTIGKKVFVTLGGDTGKSEVDWQPGFVGIAHIIKAPYDFGYNGKAKYFKFDIEMDCVLKKALKREDFLSYRDAYDAPYIGPELSRDPSQALSTLDMVKAVSVIRAVLDKFPDLQNKFNSIFSEKFMDRVLGAVTVMLPTAVKFGESKEDAVNTIHEEIMMENEISEEKEMECNSYIEPNYYTGCKQKNKDTGKVYSHNRIIFGAPGTGKSYKLNKEKEDLIDNGGECERVTFHPDYSYSHFVGAYKPVPTKNGISYEYVPGPFMRTYVKAIENGYSEGKNIKPFLLLIEEINRANAAAVFGEIFQLLDRDDKNVSQYAINPSEDVKAYLAKELGGKPEQYRELKIPDNMYIWATMNSADQGVFPMDTAFKRRWNFEYIGIDNNEDEIDGIYLVCEKAEPAYRVKWNEVRKAINDTLSSRDYKINEDKLIGPFFVAKAVLNDKDAFNEAFKSKVIMYLFEDAVRQRRGMLFNGCDEDIKNRYSAICKEFEKRGIDIFCREIRDKIKKEYFNELSLESTENK